MALGLTTMGGSVEGLAAADLQQAYRRLVRDATLKAANAQIIEDQHRLPFAPIRSSPDSWIQFYGALPFSRHRQ
jgi:hypothetical protein